MTSLLKQDVMKIPNLHQKSVYILDNMVFIFQCSFKFRPGYLVSQFLRDDFHFVLYSTAKGM